MEDGSSPFYPNTPIPADLFTGRQSQLDRISDRGIARVVSGKSATFFVEGEYGIGKSSFASVVQLLGSSSKWSLHPIYVNLGSVRNIDGLAGAFLEATIESGAFDPRKGEKVRNWLSANFGKQQAFGFAIDTSQLRTIYPDLRSHVSLSRFLRDTYERINIGKTDGFAVVLDEIDHISTDCDFANFLKGFVDATVQSPTSVPTLLIVCGRPEARRNMINCHQSVERLFDPVRIGPLTEHEVKQFYDRAFFSKRLHLTKDACNLLYRYSGGYPKVVNLIGDEVWHVNNDTSIDLRDAQLGILRAAEAIGEKYVDTQVLRSVGSEDYLSILAKIASLGPNHMSFTKQDVDGVLTDVETRKFGDFMKRMRKLNVIRNGAMRGQYEFNDPMVRLYLWLISIRDRADFDDFVPGEVTRRRLNPREKFVRDFNKQSRDFAGDETQDWDEE